MDNSDKPMSEHDSLQIIRQMINTAKQEQKDDGKGWILWGWMLFLSSIFTVINIRMHWFNTFFFWNLFGLLTLIIFVYETVANFVIKKRERVKTYTKAILRKLNVGFFFSIMFVIVAMNVGIHPIKGFALLINLYSFWILIYGAMLDFKPSYIGACIAWILGVFALFQSNFETVMLLHGAAVLCGYIIPGHIANKKFNEVADRKLNKASGV